MSDVFEVLKSDHEEVKAMLTSLETRPVGSLEERKKLTEQVIIEESKHEALEEQHFWPAVRDLGDEGAQVAETAINQEQEAKQVLAELDKLDPSDADFERLLTSFIAAAREHIAFEEDRAWPILRARISPAEARELGEKIAKGKATAPTRPHPHTPPREGVLKAAGPVAAATDKLRDAATGRGEN
jgi:hemerythrin-like domain-containing protein